MSELDSALVGITGGGTEIRVPPIKRSVEEWAKHKKTPAWLLKAAAVGARWEIGPQFDPCLVTEADFDRAVAFAANPHAVVNAPAK